MENYGKHIAVPWRSGAPAQRVIFCVYDEKDELCLRANVEEFEIITKQASHEWYLFDLTNTFAEWLAPQRYAKSYFKDPLKLSSLLPKYLIFISEEFEKFCIKNNVDANSVVAINGVGTLFGFLKVKEVVDKLAPMVNGKLMVFFPGSFDNNNYRLLDGYDGWNYLAVPITADKEF